jgi:5'-3' exonuclease
MQGMQIGNNEKTEIVNTIVYGLLNIILKVAIECQTNDIVFCWDNKESLRRDKHPFYKQKRRYERSRMPHNPVSGEDFLSIGFKTFDFLREQVLPYLGMHNQFSQPGYEADDLIAHIVKTYTEDDFVVVSNDKDLYQLLDNCDILKYEMNWYTKDSLMTEFKVTPKEWLEVKAIMGDWSDYIDGIHQVGIATAAKFVQKKLGASTKAYGRITSPEGREKIARNKWLMELPLAGVKPIDLIEAPNDITPFLKFCNKHGYDIFLSGLKLQQWRNFYNGTLSY